MVPRPPQDPSKTPLGADFTGFWTPNLMDFGTQLNGFWKDFASHLGRFLVIAWLLVRMDGQLVGNAIGWLVAWLVG